MWGSAGSNLVAFVLVRINDVHADMLETFECDNLYT